MKSVLKILNELLNSLGVERVDAKLQRTILDVVRLVRLGYEIVGDAPACAKDEPVHAVRRIQLQGRTVRLELLRAFGIGVAQHDGNRVAEARRAFREGINPVLLRAVDRERVARRAGHEGKIIHERGAARGGPGQVEVEDRTVISGNNRAAFEYHLSGYSSIAFDTEGASAGNRNSIRRAASIYP